MNLYTQVSLPVSSAGSPAHHKSQAISSKPRKNTKGIEYLQGVLSYVHSHKAGRDATSQLKNNIQINKAVES